MTELKQVIVMRKDLGMRKGKMIAQGAHASSSAISRWRNFDVVMAYMQRDQTKIVVGVVGEQALIDVAEQARSAGLPWSLIRDAGRTELEPGTATCCAIGPGPADEIDKITGGLPLL